MSVPEDFSPISIQLDSTFQDLYGDPLAFSVSVEHGKVGVEVNGGQMMLRSVADLNGNDNIVVEATGGSWSETQAFSDYVDLTPEEQAALAPIIDAWSREIDDEPDDGEAWGDFINDLDDAVPPSHLNEIDLSLWPDRVPVPPPDMPEMWKIARRAVVEGGDERLAAGWVLMQLAMARVARIYHRPRFQV